MNRNTIFATTAATLAFGAIIVGCGGSGGSTSGGATASSTGTTTGSSTGATTGSSTGSSTGATTGVTTGSSTGTTTGAPSTASIATINDSSAPMGFSFQSPMTVKSGTHVTWTNNSSAPHSIVWDNFSPSTSPAPGANIGIFSAGTSSAAWVAPTVTTNTTYNYHCGIHGSTMSGIVIVTP